MGNVVGRAGGSIAAAKFLQKFVGDMPWAHLDIAGTAWKGGAAKGSTEKPARGLLVHYVLVQSRSQVRTAKALKSASPATSKAATGTARKPAAKRPAGSKSA